MLKEAGERFVRPRFRALAAGEVTEKSPGEVVTVADREAEVFLASGLRSLRPDLPVVGEEAVAADPSLLDVLYPAGSCWLVDPVDGTSNFVNGDPSYGMAIALIERGRAIGSWIWQPEFDVAWQAELNAGTFRNGERVRVSARPTVVSELRGVFHTRFFPPEQREVVEAQPVRYTEMRGTLSSACDYPALIEGSVDFICWARILPLRPRAGHAPAHRGRWSEPTSGRIELRSQRLRSRNPRRGHPAGTGACPRYLAVRLIRSLLGRRAARRFAQLIHRVAASWLLLRRFAPDRDVAVTASIKLASVTGARPQILVA